MVLECVYQILTLSIQDGKSICFRIKKPECNDSQHCLNICKVSTSRLCVCTQSFSSVTSYKA